MYGLIFHANLQYAEIPKNEIEKVIEKSYVPSIRKLLTADIPFALNITGFSIPLLPKNLIKIIKEGLECDSIILTGTSYTHAILPLLSLTRVYEQIKKDVEIKSEFFNFRPLLFWPPELAYDPILPGILRMFGYANIFVDGEALIFSKNMNTAIKEVKVPYIRLIEASYGKRPLWNYLLGLPKLKRAMSYVFGGKVKLDGVEEITGIPVWQPVNIAMMLGLGRFPFMSRKKSIRWIKNKDDIMLYGTDLEFFGYMPFGGRVMKIDDLISFIRDGGFSIELPTKMKNSGKKFYLKTSSWAPDKTLRIWYEDEDNRRLNFLSSQMDEFLAENSDARGWMPIPERRLDAFKVIYKRWRNENE